MHQDLQKNAFIEYEADKWFERNFSVLKNYKAEDDKIINILKQYKLSPHKVLEVGCSAGYRLNGLKEIYPNADVFGIEPSKEAINYVKTHYHDINIERGTADDMSQYPDSSFDIVIVGFVFYVVDRRLLLRSISEIDRVLSDKGYLIIIDFFTETSLKRNYSHIGEFSAYSFKEKYDELFVATHLYHLIDKSCYNHTTTELDAKDDFQNLYSISLLRKDLNASYK